MNDNPIEPTAALLNDRRALLAGIGGLAAGALLVGKANAGPLDPPAGPIESTGKTLRDVEPRIAINSTNTPGDTDSLFRITQSGSYYLTGNITGVSGKHGIVIVASDVSIDLMGFDLAGVPGMGAFDGIRVAASSLTNIEVRNGSVKNWSHDGVATVNSASSRVVGVRAEGNAEAGIRTGSQSEVTGCVSRSNKFGITANTAATIHRCTAAQNTGVGIAANWASSITECVSRENGGVGINVEFNCRVSGCVAYVNGAAGIEANDSCRVVECTASANVGDGIAVNSRSTIHRCLSSDNTGDGLEVRVSNCTISECTSVSNNENGIRARHQCLVEQNYCAQNGLTTLGAGIRTANDGSRIVNNQCMGNAIGIQVDDPGNLIAANTCGGSVGLNWFIVASNSCLVVQAATTGAISGNTGGASPGSTNPNANYTY